jgi:FOG: FHA domain
MISIKCPHCNIGLKVDEAKLPTDIKSFNCPSCKKAINVSQLSAKESGQTVSETVLLHAPKEGLGRVTIYADEDTEEQSFPLFEGKLTVGRKSNASNATIGIITKDRMMSREHICIEVKKDAKGGYKHYLSDNNSKNRTLYNSIFLEDGEVVILNDNDEIILGKTVLRFNE